MTERLPGRSHHAMTRLASRRCWGTALLLAVGLSSGCGLSGSTTTVTVNHAQSSASTSASPLEAQFVAAVNRVAPSVVQIETASGLGSGEILDAQGDIVTNAHVIGTDTAFAVTLASGRHYRGKLVGVFALDDLAVIRINAVGLRPIAIASSAKLHVGDIVLAVGSPLGLQSSVTEGIVSALGRTVDEPTGAALPGVIQTSAAINPGNSGGALVNLRGELVGIPTLAASSPASGGAAPGIGFAIPSDTVRTIAGQLIRYGKVVDSGRAYLGVELGDTQGQGAYVGAVTPGGPAASAGLQAGDVITAIAGKTTPTAADVGVVLASFKPGQRVSVVVTSADGSTQTFEVKLGQYPGS
jgi:putative serine protease PepD